VAPSSHNPTMITSTGDPTLTTRSPTTNTPSSINPTPTPIDVPPTKSPANHHPSSTNPTQNPGDATSTKSPATHHPSHVAYTDSPITASPTDSTSTDPPTRPTESPATDIPTLTTKSPATNTPSSSNPTVHPTSSANPTAHPTKSPTATSPSANPTTIPTTLISTWSCPEEHCTGVMTEHYSCPFIPNPVNTTTVNTTAKCVDFCVNQVPSSVGCCEWWVSSGKCSWYPGHIVENNSNTFGVLWATCVGCQTPVPTPTIALHTSSPTTAVVWTPGHFCSDFTSSTNIAMTQSACLEWCQQNITNARCCAHGFLFGPFCHVSNVQQRCEYNSDYVFLTNATCMLVEGDTHFPTAMPTTPTLDPTAGPTNGATIPATCDAAYCTGTMVSKSLCPVDVNATRLVYIYDIGVARVVCMTWCIGQTNQTNPFGCCDYYGDDDGGECSWYANHVAVVKTKSDHNDPFQYAACVGCDPTSTSPTSNPTVGPTTCVRVHMEQFSLNSNRLRVIRRDRVFRTDEVCFFEFANTSSTLSCIYTTQIIPGNIDMTRWTIELRVPPIEHYSVQTVNGGLTVHDTVVFVTSCSNNDRIVHTSTGLKHTSLFNALSSTSLPVAQWNAMCLFGVPGRDIPVPFAPVGKNGYFSSTTTLADVCTAPYQGDLVYPYNLYYSGTRCVTLVTNTPYPGTFVCSPNAITTEPQFGTVQRPDDTEGWPQAEWSLRYIKLTPPGYKCSSHVIPSLTPLVEICYDETFSRSSLLKDVPNFTSTKSYTIPWSVADVYFLYEYRIGYSESNNIRLAINFPEQGIVDAGTTFPPGDATPWDDALWPFPNSSLYYNVPETMGPHHWLPSERSVHAGPGAALDAPPRDTPLPVNYLSTGNVRPIGCLLFAPARLLLHNGMIPINTTTTNLDELLVHAEGCRPLLINQALRYT
jgi:hypothetical protein